MGSLSKRLRIWYSFPIISARAWAQDLYPYPVTGRHPDRSPVKSPVLDLKKWTYDSVFWDGEEHARHTVGQRVEAVSSNDEGKHIHLGWCFKLTFLGCLLKVSKQITQNKQKTLAFQDEGEITLWLLSKKWERSVILLLFYICSWAKPARDTGPSQDSPTPIPLGHRLPLWL